MTKIDHLLEGKVTLVTGGAQGIGLAIAKGFSAAGAAVMIGDLNTTGAESAAADLDPGGTLAHGIGMDVADESSTEDAIAACVARFGRLDVVVANAGVLVLEHVVDTSVSDWQRVLDVNLTGAFLTSRHAARHFLEQKSGGRIIFTSSLFGRRGGAENGAYSASKFGVIGLAESLAAELAPHGICVNAVCPGQIETDMIRSLFRDRAQLTSTTEAEVEQAVLSRIPMGRLAAPTEVADTFVYLASDLSSYVTGQSLVVDGGWFVG